MAAYLYGPGPIQDPENANLSHNSFIDCSAAMKLIADAHFRHPDFELVYMDSSEIQFIANGEQTMLRRLDSFSQDFTLLIHMVMQLAYANQHQCAEQVAVTTDFRHRGERQFLLYRSV